MGHDPSCIRLHPRRWSGWDDPNDVDKVDEVDEVDEVAGKFSASGWALSSLTKTGEDKRVNRYPLPRWVVGRVVFAG